MRLSSSNGKDRLRNNDYYACRALESANSDLNSKREIEDFLNQYPDRPLVPEHWAYDTTLNTYVWKGPPVDRNGKELDLKTWKGFNF